MQTISLQVEDDYVEEFISTLPYDKVTVLKENFEKNRAVLQNALENYREDESDFMPYYESMTELDSWLKERTK